MIIVPKLRGTAKQYLNVDPLKTLYILYFQMHLLFAVVRAAKVQFIKALFVNKLHSIIIHVGADIGAHFSDVNIHCSLKS